jgi:TRAP-type C4-dicarboxylate transport system permease small subunit
VNSLWEKRADAMLGIVASALLFSMMVLTFFDVVGRYLLNKPIRGAFEITELLLLVLIFAGPAARLARRRARHDGLHRPHPARPAGRGSGCGLMHAICVAIMAFLTWQVWIKAGKIAAYGDTTDVLRIPSRRSSTS